MCVCVLALDRDMYGDPGRNAEVRSVATGDRLLSEGKRGNATRRRLLIAAHYVCTSVSVDYVHAGPSSEAWAESRNKLSQIKAMSG